MYNTNKLYFIYQIYLFKLKYGKNMSNNYHELILSFISYLIKKYVNNIRFYIIHRNSNQ